MLEDDGTTALTTRLSFKDDIYDSGKTEGIELGKAEGIQLGKKELVLNMYKNDMGTDVIAKMVQISLETILQWISGTAKPARQPFSNHKQTLPRTQQDN